MLNISRSSTLRVFANFNAALSSSDKLSKNFGASSTATSKSSTASALFSAAFSSNSSIVNPLLSEFPISSLNLVIISSSESVINPSLSICFKFSVFVLLRSRFWFIVSAIASALLLSLLKDSTTALANSLITFLLSTLYLVSTPDRLVMILSYFLSASFDSCLGFSFNTASTGTSSSFKSPSLDNLDLASLRVLILAFIATLSTSLPIASITSLIFFCILVTLASLTLFIIFFAVLLDTPLSSDSFIITPISFMTSALASLPCFILALNNSLTLAISSLSFCAETSLAFLLSFFTASINSSNPCLNLSVILSPLVSEAIDTVSFLKFLLISSLVNPKFFSTSKVSSLVRPSFFDSAITSFIV